MDRAKRSRIKKILYGVATLFLVILGVLAIVPRFINWNQYKPLIQEKAQAYLGQNLTIDGDIKLTLLPSPAFSVHEVRLSNVSQATTPYMITLKEASVSVGLFPLLKKELHITHLEIIKPEIEVERFSNGKTNWDFLTALSDKENAFDETTNNAKKEESKLQSSIHLNSITIAHGQLTFREKDKVIRIQGFNTELYAQNLQGPFQIRGSLIYEKFPLSFKVNTGQLEDLNSFKIQVDIIQGLHKASFEGQLNLNKKETQGHLISQIDGQALFPFESSLSQPITLENNILANSQQILLSDLSLMVSGVKASGAASLKLEGIQEYQLQLNALPGQASIQARGALAHINPFQGKLTLVCEDVPKFLDWAKINSTAIHGSLQGKFSLQTSLIASSKEIQVTNLTMSLGQSRILGNLTWKNKKLIAEVQTPDAKPWLLLAGIKNTFNFGALAIKAEGEGDLHGLNINSRLKVLGGNFALKGKLNQITKDLKYKLFIELSHPNLNTLLRAFNAEPQTVSLGGSTLESQIEGTVGKIKFTNFKGSLNPQGHRVFIKGNGFMDFSQKKPVINATLSMGHVVLDHFLSTSRVIKSSSSSRPQPNQSFPSSSQRWSHEPIDFSVLNPADISLKVHADSLKYKTYHLQPFALDINLSNGILTFPTMAGGIFGGKFQGSALLSAQGTPSFQTTLSLKRASLQSLLGPTSQLNIKGGDIDMDVNLKTQGRSSYQFVSHLNGHIALLAQDGVFEGFDLHKISQSLKSVNSIEGITNLLVTAMSSGKTPFEVFKGNFNIHNGIASPSDLTLISKVATAKGYGFIDLPKWFMDIKADIKLLDFPKLPPFKFYLRGPLDAPQHSVDKGNLASEFLKNFGGKAIDMILKKATGLSISLPGLEKKKPEDQDRESSDQQAQPSPELKPEKVIEDVFKGLFK